MHSLVLVLVLLKVHQSQRETIKLLSIHTSDNFSHEILNQCPRRHNSALSYTIIPTHNHIIGTRPRDEEGTSPCPRFCLSHLSSKIQCLFNRISQTGYEKPSSHSFISHPKRVPNYILTIITNQNSPLCLWQQVHAEMR